MIVKNEKKWIVQIFEWRSKGHLSNTNSHILTTNNKLFEQQMHNRLSCSLVAN